MTAITNALHRYRTPRRRSNWTQTAPAIAAGVVLVGIIAMWVLP